MSKDPTFTATNTIVYNGVGGRGEGGGRGVLMAGPLFILAKGGGWAPFKGLHLIVHLLLQSKVFKGIAY